MDDRDRSDTNEASTPEKKRGYIEVWRNDVGDPMRRERRNSVMTEASLSDDGIQDRRM